MKALAIHVLGYTLLNLIMPSWVEEAGWYILAVWYGAYVAVDLVALTCCKDEWLAFVLALSAAWSASIMIEVSLLSDVMQSNDWMAQIFITTLLVIAAVRMLIVASISKDKMRGA